MRLVLLLALASLTAPTHSPRLSAKCVTRDKACLSWIAANSSKVLASYLSLSGGTVDMTGVTFTRNSAGAACTDASGNVTFPATNQPCANSTGLHVRAAISNLLTYTDALDNAAWTKAGVTATADSATAPDGTASADTLTNSATGGYVYQAFASAGGAAALSLYASYSSAVSYAVEIYDATTSTSLRLSSCTTATSWPAAPWLRCTASVSSTTSGDSIQFRVYPGGTTGGAGAAIYAWGAQAEWSAYASDYCPSGATPTTCAVEAATVAIPDGLSETSGCVEECLTPSWTGAIPGAAGTQLKYVAANSTDLLLYSIQTLSTVRAFDGTRFPEVSGAFSAGARKCYRTTWDSSAGTLAVENLATSTTSSVAGFTGLTFQTTLSLGPTSPAVGIDTMELGSGPGACK